jgi:chromosome partitioning protein
VLPAAGISTSDKGMSMKQKASKNAQPKRAGAVSKAPIRSAPKPKHTLASTKVGATSKSIKPQKLQTTSNFQTLPTPKEMRVVALCNQKGGCGKTTSVINIAAGLAALGQRVLVIDLDSQCNATTGLGIDLNDVEFSTFDLMMSPKPETLEQVILETDYKNLHVAPASIELSEFESRASSEIGRENRLKKAVNCLKGLYDFVIIDTPPSLGLLSVNALNAATEVHIALQAQPFAFDGLRQLLDTISLVKEELNTGLNVTGVIMTMYDNRTRISREIMDMAQELPILKGRLFTSLIRQNIKVTEATKMRKPVMYYDANCTGTKDYLDLSKEICAQHDLLKTTSHQKAIQDNKTKNKSVNSQQNSKRS